MHTLNIHGVRSIIVEPEHAIQSGDKTHYFKDVRIQTADGHITICLIAQDKNALNFLQQPERYGDD